MTNIPKSSAMYNETDEHFIKRIHETCSSLVQVLSCLRYGMIIFTPRSDKIHKAIEEVKQEMKEKGYKPEQYK